MQSYTEKNLQARDLYFNAGKPSGEIARTIGVDRKTVYNWIKQGKWEEMKIAAAQAPGVLLQNIYNHIDEVNKKISKRHVDDRCPTMLEIDMLRKLIGMVKGLNKISVGGYMQCYQELSTYISAHDPALADAVSGYTENFIQENMVGLRYYTKPIPAHPGQSRDEVAPAHKPSRTPKCMLKTNPEPPETKVDQEAYYEWKTTLDGFLTRQGIEVRENVEEPWPVEEDLSLITTPATEVSSTTSGGADGEKWGNEFPTGTTTEKPPKPATEAQSIAAADNISPEGYPQKQEIPHGEIDQTEDHFTNNFAKVTLPKSQPSEYRLTGTYQSSAT